MLWPGCQSSSGGVGGGTAGPPCGTREMGTEQLNEEVLERDNDVGWWWILAAALPEDEMTRGRDMCDECKLSKRKREPFRHALLGSCLIRCNGNDFALPQGFLTAGVFQLVDVCGQVGPWPPPGAAATAARLLPVAGGQRVVRLAAALSAR